MNKNESNRRLAERLDKLEREMEEIKSMLKDRETEPEEKKGTKQPFFSQPERRDSYSSEETKKDEGKTKPTGRDWEAWIGQVWLPRVFIVVLLIGVVWAFQSAVENNWITEPIRVLIGFVASVVLAITGVYQTKRERRGLGVSLIGGGAGVWIFSTFAGTVLYGLIQTPSAFILYVIGIFTGLYLSHVYKSQALAVFLTIAGFFVPFLVGGEGGDFFVFFFYEMLLVVALGVYAWRREYIVLLYATTLLPSVTFFVYVIASALTDTLGNNTGPVDQYDIFAYTVVAIHIALSILLFYSEALSRAKGTLLSLTFTAAVIWLFVTPLSPASIYEYGWVTLIVSVLDAFLVAGALLYGGIAYRIRHSGDMLFHLYTLFAVVLGTFEIFRIFDYEGSAILYLVEAIALYRLGFGINSRVQTVLASIFFIIGASLTLSNLEYIESAVDVPIFEGVTAAIVSGLVYLLFRSYTGNKVMTDIVRRTCVYVFAGAGIGFALLTLTQVAFQIGEENFYDYRDIAVSISWILFAVAALTAGILKDKRPLRIFAIVWIFITLGKAFLVDISYIDAIVRGLLFIGLGVVGVLVSRFFYRANKQNDN
ncbi:DUF2339 domain-containing protein [Salimicrobium humidisoli]|uniref:Membrane protein DUF2339 n=1 Tax=Salimicrobium humidisoli TaxID=2029857 RepID=A0ABX4HTE5_9BACI|nr:DUF2339 domain-containing protein [Salimicrobium humidisoli]PBB06313.1 hypothetical protein CKW00_04590 [Salimicrobium humidisoli]